MKQAGAVAMTNAYNGCGEQVRKHLGANNTYTVYDEAGHWLGDYDSSGAPLQQALWMDDLPVGLLANGNQLHYLQPDHLGTPRVVIEVARNVPVWTWDVKGEAFGNTAPDQNPDGDANNFVLDMRFPGQRFDAVSGLNYNYFRDYDSTTGRYLESDPIGLKGGPSTYAYVGGDPYSFIDSSGLVRIQDCPGCDGDVMQGVLKSAKRWCGDRLLDKRIKDVALRNCIKSRCESTLVVCDNNCPKFNCGSSPNDPNGVITRARGPSQPNDPSKITLCISEKPAPGGWGATVIHEFSHTCDKSSGGKWRHGDGFGVLNDPGVDDPNRSKCYRVN